MTGTIKEAPAMFEHPGARHRRYPMRLNLTSYRWPDRPKQPIVVGDVAYVPVSGRSTYALIDAVDVGVVLGRFWSQTSSLRNRTMYAMTMNDRYRHPERSAILMHRLIINAPKGSIVDHINGDGLDNRRCNLRFCTLSQNALNRHVLTESNSGTPNIYWHSRDKRWRVYFKRRGKGINVGSFTSLEMAQQARLDWLENRLHEDWAAWTGGKS